MLLKILIKPIRYLVTSCNRNRYVKLWTVNMRARERDKNISEEARDNVKLFFDRFQITQTLTAVKKY